MTSEEIKKILDGAPDGTTHYDSCGWYWVIHADKPPKAYFENKWLALNPNYPLSGIDNLREILELRQEVEQLQQRNAELAQERDALAAHVERLGDAIVKIDSSVTEGGCGYAIAEAVSMVESTPQQNLNAVQREAIIKAINNAKSKEKYSLPLVETTELYEYANTKYPTEGE